MPGVLVDDTYNGNPACVVPASPHSAPSHLPHLRHYIPVFTNLPAAQGYPDEESLPLQLSPRRRPGYLNVTSLPHDETSLDAGLALWLPPVQWGYDGASPTTSLAPSALWQFLPPNAEEDDGGNAQLTDMYSCDDFRMYEFKVRRCTRGRSHDWTDCPFAHPGEKARRRDPRRFHYSGTACTEFRRGSCKKGDSCEYAHGVFECWLHPTRYRTQVCNDGQECQRRICFFAHTPDQLRLISEASLAPSALSSPTSPQSSSSFRSPSKKASSRMAMEVICESYLPQTTVSSLALSKSSPTAATPINRRSPKGLTALALPGAALHPSIGASFAAVPMHLSHWERRVGESLHLPNFLVRSGSKSGMSESAWTPSYMPESTPAQSRAKDSMYFWKQADLREEETDHRLVGTALGVRAAGFLDESGPTLWRQACTQAVGEVGQGPSKKGVSEELLIGHVGDDEEEERGPKLERVESGKGLRAQIFQSLLRSSSQPSCRTYQDLNSEHLRSSSSLGL